MATNPNDITLNEQTNQQVFLAVGDARLLQRLSFNVLLTDAVSANDGDASIACFVNPTSYVGHFKLPSGRIVIVRPKIDAACVFQMLGYIFTDEHRKLFELPEVQYASERLLFEPLVERFSTLVTARTKRGLLQDYIRREENLGVLRGALNIRAHVQENLGRENRVHCRFFEQTVDIPDNRFVKAALWHLLRFGGWTPRTTQSLIRNLHHFDGVTLEPLRPQGMPNRHYHRLNDDYQPIHELCRLFAECSSVSEHFGSIRLNGLLLDMNKLFEKFVEKAFVNVSRRSECKVNPQESTLLSLSTGSPKIRPDVTVWSEDRVVAIADAKYKKDYSTPPNTDVYQVITYGTVLDCPEVYLLYPETEVDAERDLQVINSPIVVKTRQVNIGSTNAVESTEALARSILLFGKRAAAIEAA